MSTFLLLLGLTLCLQAARACPTHCSCKWKGGKETVDCANKGLITIPYDIDFGTQVLEFDKNNLDRLLNERFLRIGLVNLQKIFMSNCKIRVIEERAFKGLSNLVELDLGDNLITKIPTETFKDYPSLMRLNLSGNPIKIIQPSSFHALAYLTNLELHSCGIEVIEDGAFLGLNSLEWLKLNRNYIKHIKGSRILPENLHGIELQDNPWQCDCLLIDLRDWLVKLNLPTASEPTCSSPLRLQSRLIKSVSLEDLACAPTVNPTSFYLEIAEGKNVSLFCRVTAVPEAKVSWWFDGNVLQNETEVAPGLHLYYFIEEGSTKKTSELFILNASSENNGTFICTAENSAGKAHSNYTIRILLKEGKALGVRVFEYDYIVVIAASFSILGVLTIIITAVCFVTCRRSKRGKRKKDRNKVAAVPNQQTADKIPAIVEKETITNIGPPPVMAASRNELVIPPERELIVYSSGPIAPGAFTYNYPLVSFHDQNPDIVNDTSLKEWRQSVKELSKEKEKDVPWNPGIPREAMLHLAPEVPQTQRNFIGQDGYPADFGLPKIGPLEMHMNGMTGAFYRTLPHKSRCITGNPPARFSRDAEFYSKPCKPAPFEHYSSSQNVRYTLGGYPELPPTLQEPLIITPPAPYIGDQTKAVQWIGANPPPVDGLVKPERELTVSQIGEVLPGLPSTPEEVEPCQDVAVVAESPDEGYEGDSADTSDPPPHPIFKDDHL